MKRYLSGLICSGLLLVSGPASSFYAQTTDATAQKHVAAAKALAATSNNATQPWQNFDYAVVVNKELPKRLRQIVNECLQAQMAWRTKS
jgi:hypothetical protein